MALYTFGDQTGPIPLSQLDYNFAQPVEQSNVANTVVGQDGIAQSYGQIARRNIGSANWIQVALHCEIACYDSIGKSTVVDKHALGI